MRSTCSIGLMKILPSPILSVRAACTIASKRSLEQLLGTTRLDLDLRQQVDDVLRAAIQLGVAFLPTVTLDLGDGQSGHARLGERFAHLFELERPDDGGDQLHGMLRG